MNFRKIFNSLVLILSIAVLTAFSGCGKKGPRKRQIGFLLTLNHPYWRNMQLGAEDEAEKLGVEVTILNA